MPLSRIAWIVTAAICAVASVLLFVSGYLGYGGVLIAIGLSALINLK